MRRPVYLDNHATTPLDPRVLEAMMPYLTTAFGNAASRNHAYGWEAEAAVDRAREQVARLLGGRAEEIVFTSGATESDNLAVLGLARAARGRGRHVVTAATEHHAVLDACRQLAREGVEVTYLPVASDGSLEPDAVAGAIRPDTVLVSLMLANNEIGTIHPIGEIAAVCRERGVAVHTDAVQGVGTLAFHVDRTGVDLASVSAHKIYGPKGVGALYVRQRRPRVRLEPLLYGGGQERGLRSGTLNVAGIVGLGRACELAGEEREAESRRLRMLRKRLYAGIAGALPGVRLNGPELPELGAAGECRSAPERRLPGNLNLSFEGIEGEALLAGIPEVALSSGAACTTAAIEPSHVLAAIGVAPELARATLRFGLGRFNTEEDVDFAAERVTAAARGLRAAARA